MDETPTNTNAAPAPEAAAPAPAPAGEKKSHTGVIIAIIIAAVLIVAGAIICVLLLTSNKDGGSNNDGNNGGNGGDNKNTTSLVSCITEGDTWKYGNELTVDNENLKVTKMKYVLETNDDYVADDLTEDERTLLVGAAFIFTAFSTNDDPGVKVNTISEGDPVTGAGASMNIEINRAKLKDEEALKNLEELDGKTAKELAKMIEADSYNDIKMTCEIK